MVTMVMYVGEVTFEADVYGSVRDRVEHATGSFPKVASRRAQCNNHTMNTIGGTRVNDGNKADVHNTMARPVLQEGLRALSYSFSLCQEM